VEDTFELYLDVKKATYDEKYIDDENEKDLTKKMKIKTASTKYKK
jgi:hypothetical protein